MGTPKSRVGCIYITHGAVMNRLMPATDGAPGVGKIIHADVSVSVSGIHPG